MKELNIFIDESGDFGECSLPAYYLVTFVFHKQGSDIISQVKKLEDSIKASGFSIEYIHTAPVIRRETVFSNYSIDERRKLLYIMLNFIMSSPISHYTIAINRKEAGDKVSLSGKLGQSITRMIDDYRDLFYNYDKIIVYYDNGQHELSAILNAAFSAHFSNVEFRKATPKKYRLLQVADFICTMELLKIKRNEKRLSKSEKKFFYQPNELKKVFLKGIEKKKLHLKK